MAAIDFLAEHGLPDGDLDWLLALDASGLTPRREVARALSERYGGIDAQDFLDRGAADRITLSDPVREALVEARAEGWSCVIVANGRTVQQEPDAGSPSRRSSTRRPPPEPRSTAHG